MDMLHKILPILPRKVSGVIVLSAFFLLTAALTTAFMLYAEKSGPQLSDASSRIIADPRGVRPGIARDELGRSVVVPVQQKRYTLRGEVYDQYNIPVRRAQIRALGLGASGLSDPNGAFILSVVVPSTTTKVTLEVVSECTIHSGNRKDVPLPSVATEVTVPRFVVNQTCPEFANPAVSGSQGNTDASQLGSTITPPPTSAGNRTVRISGVVLDNYGLAVPARVYATQFFSKAGQTSFDGTYRLELTVPADTTQLTLRAEAQGPRCYTTKAATTSVAIINSSNATDFSVPVLRFNRCS